MINAIEELILEIAQGHMVILIDDESRENEGDLIMAAAHVTPQAINFMARFGRGLICMPMAGEMIDRLGLPLMVEDNQSSQQTAFTVSIGARYGITTGISAADRAHTIATAVSTESSPSDIVSPGHVFPLRAREGGIFNRQGHTEAAVDLTRIAGLPPAAVICEIMNDNGSMARLPELLDFAKMHGLKIGTIAGLVEYRQNLERGQAA
ncbi:MAG: 3,4-dihydroxy-2-butanone-4-phosphate synthase [Micavibrio aeruginosavorus]|uniref:3,4-dihydroxy-2-butanone 4-phosphate synthase n=1 Tax=Micavibrio aeruginosavorus TaxID=349221 RepID=A0A7T5R1C8_9BACT|nr:MAG: 3,4-dihydroxy-2-butanone-4-phosphate synthase [Micavibrio aeruginosavorus]